MGKVDTTPEERNVSEVTCSPKQSPGNKDEQETETKDFTFKKRKEKKKKNEKCVTTTTKTFLLDVRGF